MALILIQIIDREAHKPGERIKNPSSCTKAGDPISSLNDGERCGGSIITGGLCRIAKIDGTRAGIEYLFETKYGLEVTDLGTPINTIYSRKYKYNGSISLKDFSKDYKNPTLILKTDFVEKT